MRGGGGAKSRLGKVMVGSNLPVGDLASREIFQLNSRGLRFRCKIIVFRIKINISVHKCVHSQQFVNLTLAQNAWERSLHSLKVEGWSRNSVAMVSLKMVFR